MLEGRRASVRLRREHRAWVIEQREFEHEQFRQVLDRRWKDRKYTDRHEAARGWTAISEQRAMEIAIAALNNSNPPQGRN